MEGDNKSYHQWGERMLANSQTQAHNHLRIHKKLVVGGSNAAAAAAAAEGRRNSQEAEHTTARNPDYH